jgi:hypothetical protein
MWWSTGLRDKLERVFVCFLRGGDGMAAGPTFDVPEAPDDRVAPVGHSGLAPSSLEWKP